MGSTEPVDGVIALAIGRQTGIVDVHVLEHGLGDVGEEGGELLHDCVGSAALKHDARPVLVARGHLVVEALAVQADDVVALAHREALLGRARARTLEQVALAARALGREQLQVAGQVARAHVGVEGAVGEAQALAGHVGVAVCPAGARRWRWKWRRGRRARFGAKINALFVFEGTRKSERFGWSLQKCRYIIEYKLMFLIDSHGDRAKIALLPMV